MEVSLCLRSLLSPEKRMEVLGFLRFEVGEFFVMATISNDTLSSSVLFIPFSVQE